MLQKMLLYVLVLLSANSLAALPSWAQDEGEELSRQDLYLSVLLSSPGFTLNSLPATFSFPNDARLESSFGIDISHHNEDNCDCKIDWSLMSDQRVRFVYLKATQGTEYVDPTFQGNSEELNVLGSVDVGAYHFLTANGDAVAQAQNFLRATKNNSRMTLPPTLDLEWNLGAITANCPPNAITVLKKRNGTIERKCDLWSTLNPDEIVAKVQKWIETVKAETGVTATVYTNAEWWKARVGNREFSILSPALLWIADYSKLGRATENPTVPLGSAWAYWQFTSAAKLSAGSEDIMVDASIIFVGK